MANQGVILVENPKFGSPPKLLMNDSFFFDKHVGPGPVNQFR